MSFGENTRPTTQFYPILWDVTCRLLPGTVASSLHLAFLVTVRKATRVLNNFARGNAGRKLEDD